MLTALVVLTTTLILLVGWDVNLRRKLLNAHKRAENPVLSLNFPIPIRDWRGERKWVQALGREYVCYGDRWDSVYVCSKVRLEEFKKRFIAPQNLVQAIDFLLIEENTSEEIAHALKELGS